MVKTPPHGKTSIKSKKKNFKSTFNNLNSNISYLPEITEFEMKRINLPIGYVCASMNIFL